MLLSLPIDEDQVIGIDCEIPGEFFRGVAEASDQRDLLKRFERLDPAVERPWGIRAENGIGLPEILPEAVAVGQEDGIERAIERRIVSDLRLRVGANRGCGQPDQDDGSGKQAPECGKRSLHENPENDNDRR
jgi:hypothetical protein